MKIICEFCKKPIGLMRKILNSVKGDSNTFCRDSHAIFHQQKLRSDKVIKEIKQLLLENKQIVSREAPIPIKPSPIRKCPQCLQFYETHRPMQKCCSKSCARKYFNSTHQIKYSYTKKLDLGQIELTMNDNKKIK